MEEGCSGGVTRGGGQTISLIDGAGGECQEELDSFPPSFLVEHPSMNKGEIKAPLLSSTGPQRLGGNATAQRACDEDHNTE